MGGITMVSIIVTIVVAAVIVWAWRRRGRMHTIAVSPGGIPPETLALDAFTHGNACLAAGKFAEASAAFQRARELDPKRPHVAERLAEVERRQRAVTATPPASAVP
jgi:Flp pilus assembly protein TadD